MTAPTQASPADHSTYTIFHQQNNTDLRFGALAGSSPAKDSLHPGLNRGPSVYKTDALPLSYAGFGPGWLGKLHNDNRPEPGHLGRPDDIAGGNSRSL